MSSPSSDGPYSDVPAPAAAAVESPGSAISPPAHSDGNRTNPGPRVHRAGWLLPRHPYVGADNLLRRIASLRYPAVSSGLAALALAACGVLILQLVHRQTGTTGLLVGLGLALLPLPFVLGALAWLNLTARVPLRHTLFCLAWGACAATTVAIMANGWASDFLIAHRGSMRGETLVAEFATPLIEETAKGAALIMLLLPVRRRLRCRAERTCAVLMRRSPAPLRRSVHRLRAAPRLRRHLRPLPYFRPAPYHRPHTRGGRRRARSNPRTLAAGVVLGGATACGFSFTENALYLGRAFTDDQQTRMDNIGLGAQPSLRDFDSTVHTFVLRGLLSPFAHPLFTALTGLGLAISLTTGRRWLARLAAPVGLLLAMALHGTWNAAAGLGTHGFLLVYGLLMVPAFAALVCFAVWAGARTARRARHPAGQPRQSTGRGAPP
ncbi:PrsW family intramembrane metalloprotease [Kitasatospora sp. GP82]|uniref:PrsW family intramembrane metalloprotease n=1 Tax=Kitasatospora sp. GP82 TaxID=3035089 RepID=UPI0024739807|nr:PrsW family intramembrane metalloprotease [Kitasatospora sp. GP82]MDH6128998.1 RsiW-degrading membrane proteinase PrsW (M82 family) [Kitasatospora sp. GP82]